MIGCSANFVASESSGKTIAVGAEGNVDDA